uniref:Uncharacterized protein n=1 Tax=Spongospora subterranea TaxID=70186 RepID=A0A0H5QVF7_9EUKA|eukprot:CRZ05581.1 hypothetical protein [Spongospora subterranea]
MVVRGMPRLLSIIQGTTILSIDDDQYRLTSVLSEEMEFARINNPKKAFGVVSTNAVSLVSSVVLDLRLAGKGEGFGNIAQIILMWMQNVGLLPELVEFLCRQEFNFIGTYKRIKSAPFTFGNVPGSRGRSQIQEEGAKSIYVAPKKIGNRWVYSIAYRGGRGRVAMLFSTDPRLNTWICKHKHNIAEPLAGHNLIRQCVHETTIALTVGQGKDAHTSQVLTTLQKLDWNDKVPITLTAQLTTPQQPRKETSWRG